MPQIKLGVPESRSSPRAHSEKLDFRPGLFSTPCARLPGREDCVMVEGMGMNRARLIGSRQWEARPVESFWGLKVVR